ncbi:restriction endonuclease [Helicobacter apodemus]|uniref:site-specific DNA-methyltransferase (adenine-specific) n=2 Tax=Helicobacter apodemus TaxID=135569 RepID=A0A2U8FCN8_9HELI|nr:restriction endonuclease [Helicobacter apodemus]
MKRGRLMKELLQNFQYIQRYSKDNLESLKIILQFLLVHQNISFKDKLLSVKERQIPKSFYQYLQSLNIEPILIDEKLNWKKILRSLGDLRVSLENIERFIQAIALQKTILKFYDYVTPIEINTLILELLEIKKGESIYNPCCGMGSWIFSLKEWGKDCIIYGEDINEELIGIAKILASLAGVRESHFQVVDVLDISFSKDSKTFDKIFCHPPLTRQNLPNFKEDLRFIFLDNYSKIAPEIPFLAHSLAHFKTKAIFIIRSVLLYKDLGKKFCKYLISNRLLECVMELPKNIFPHQMGEFCLLVLSKENKKILFMDFKSFCLKEGKYNRIINKEEILDLYFSKQNGAYSQLVSYELLNESYLKPSFYMQDTLMDNRVKLKEYLKACFRGQRIDTKDNKDLIECYDMGIKDFEDYGFTNTFGEYSLKTSSKKIQDIRLCPYDILLAIRGVNPKVAIIGEEIKDKIVIANAGILVLRLRDYAIAKALYLYFISKEGRKSLSEIYQDNNERIGEREIRNFCIPNNFLKDFQEKFENLCKESAFIKIHQQNIQSLLGFKE